VAPPPGATSAPYPDGFTVDSDHERRELRRIERGCELEDPQWTSRMRGELAPARPASGLGRRVLMDVFGVVWLLIGIISGVLLLDFVAILVLTAAACMHVDAASAKRRLGESD
jgi:Protein of unknown function (DUF3040)